MVSSSRRSVPAGGKGLPTRRSRVPLCATGGFAGIALYRRCFSSLRRVGAPPPTIAVVVAVHREAEDSHSTRSSWRCRSGMCALVGRRQHIVLRARPRLPIRRASFPGYIHAQTGVSAGAPFSEPQTLQVSAPSRSRSPSSCQLLAFAVLAAAHAWQDQHVGHRLQPVQCHLAKARSMRCESLASHALLSRSKGRALAVLGLSGKWFQSPLDFRSPLTPVHGPRRRCSPDSARRGAESHPDRVSEDPSLKTRLKQRLPCSRMRGRVPPLCNSLSSFFVRTRGRDAASPALWG